MTRMTAHERAAKYRTIIRYKTPEIRRLLQGRVYSGAKPRGRHEPGPRANRPKERWHTYRPPPEKYAGQRAAYLVGAWRPMTAAEMNDHNAALVGG